MNKEYKYIKVLNSTGNWIAQCELKKRCPCDIQYFIDNFWMAIKNSGTVKEKVVLLFNPDKKRFCLCYNMVAAIGSDAEHPTEKQFEFCEKDAGEIIELTLRQIDFIMGFLYCETRTPIIKEENPIQSIKDDSIQMNGRLPMLESVFVKKYWSKIVKRHHKRNKGIRFEIRFSELGTKISVSAELCHQNNLRAKNNIQMEHEDRKLADIAIQEILCDLADAIQECARKYAKACDDNQ